MLEGRQDAGAVPAASTINTSLNGVFIMGAKQDRLMLESSKK